MGKPDREFWDFESTDGKWRGTLTGPRGEIDGLGDQELLDRIDHQLKVQRGYDAE